MLFSWVAVPVEDKEEESLRQGLYLEELPYGHVSQVWTADLPTAQHTQGCMAKLTAPVPHCQSRSLGQSQFSLLLLSLAPLSPTTL